LSIILFADLFNVQYIISIITKTIDLFVVIVIGASALQTALPALIRKIGFRQKTKENNITIKNFIKSLLLALEMESANAVLKMGMFTINTPNVDSHVSQNTNNFIFFVAVLSVRIAINQTLRRFNIN
jgi:hypothetical protein